MHAGRCGHLGYLFPLRWFPWCSGQPHSATGLPMSLQKALEFWITSAALKPLAPTVAVLLPPALFVRCAGRGPERNTTVNPDPGCAGRGPERDTTVNPGPCFAGPAGGIGGLFGPGESGWRGRCQPVTATAPARMRAIATKITMTTIACT